MTLTKNGKRVGRPPGRKNAATILKEEGRKKLTKAAADTLYAELPSVVEAMVKEAKGGNVNAAKLILDRVLPAGVGNRTEVPNITINVGEISNAEAAERQQIVTVREARPPARTFEVEAERPVVQGGDAD